MAFSRRRKFVRRRRKRLPETYTFRQCRPCYNLFGDMTCSTPHIDMILLLSMATQRNPTLADTTELTSGSDKFIVFDGMKFQDEWYFDNSLIQSCATAPGPVARSMQTILSIWEALVILPFVQGSSTVPAYTVNLTSGSLQQGDVADRVLWKRVSHLRIFGPDALPGTTIAWMDHTGDHQGHGPVAVKTRARLDDRHGLFLVRNFVHDVFFGFSPSQPCGALFDCDSCLGGTQPACGVVPVFNDFYSKIFYHARK